MSISDSESSDEFKSIEEQAEEMGIISKGPCIICGHIVWSNQARCKDSSGKYYHMCSLSSPNSEKRAVCMNRESWCRRCQNCNVRLTTKRIFHWYDIPYLGELRPGNNHCKICALLKGWIK